MKASINKKNCMLCGICGGLCPEVFRVDIDRKSVALDIEISEELLATVRYAESICPTWSISLQDSPSISMQ